MSSCVKFRLAARTEAAGKYDPSAPQEGNEDNYGVIADISNQEHRPAFDEESVMGDMGVLMFVSDGMGGHNAGEVASKIAVDTVYESFGQSKVSPGIAASHEARSIYMEGVIREADKRVRAYAAQHSECEGMGATIIIAWLMGDELTISWCGDSRCYLYRAEPEPKIAMVSEDHSYVQELVQRGVIPYEATFAHPRGNIVTRCLGGGGDTSIPESRMAKIDKGDVILLCSDGLSGVLFDDGRLFDGQPISQENICDILTAEKASLRTSLQALFDAAQRAEWYDNVTAILCQVTDGVKSEGIWPPVTMNTVVVENEPVHKKKTSWIAVVLVVVALLVVSGWLFSSHIFDKSMVNTVTSEALEETAESQRVEGAVASVKEEGQTQSPSSAETPSPNSSASSPNTI